MVIMGIDASTTCTGWSIFNDGQLVAHGAIHTKGDDWRTKIMQETMELAAIMRQYRPIVLYAENVPLKDGKPTLVKLGAVHGMLLSLCAAFHIDPHFLLPNEWRHPLGLYDGTRKGLERDVLKKKAIEMVNDVFGLTLRWVAPKSKRNEDDEAEAILVAYSQIIQKGV